jgi:hypothetical protein
VYRLLFIGNSLFHFALKDVGASHVFPVCGSFKLLFTASEGVVFEGKDGEQKQPNGVERCYRRGVI